MFPWTSALDETQREETRSEGVDVDKTGQAWRGQALQQRTPLVGFVKKEKTMAEIGYDGANDNSWLKQFPWGSALDLTIGRRDAKRGRRCRLSWMRLARAGSVVADSVDWVC